MTLRFRQAAVLMTVSFAALLMLVFSDSARVGVAKGLSLAARSVIPSLFLFTTAAVLISKLIADMQISRPASANKRHWASDVTVWLLSAVSGYPVGARLINGLYKDGAVSRQKAVRMLTYSVNAGPAFIITAVGEQVLGDRKDGIRLFVCLLISAVILTVAVTLLPDRFFKKAADTKTSQPTDRKQNIETRYLSDMFVESVMEAGQTMLNLCFFIIFFSGVGGVLEQSGLPYAEKASALLEVTVGVQSLTAANFKKAAFLLGFSGISVIFQVMSAARDVRPPLKVIVISRVFHGLIACGVAELSLLLFPRSVETGSFGGYSVNAAPNTGPFAVAAMVLLCVVLLDSGARLYYNKH